MEVHPCPPDVARRVVELFRKSGPIARTGNELTPHEMRLLGLLIEGHNYKTAAAQLDRRSGRGCSFN